MPPEVPSGQNRVGGVKIGETLQERPDPIFDRSKMPAAEVAVLVADRSASPSGIAVVIRRVNGIDVVRKGSPAIEVVPGTQVIQVEVLRGGTSVDGYAEARSFSTISFDTAAGQRYRVRGIFENGLGKVWVVGQDGAPVPSQPLRAKE
mgnify:CR=1 FL=1